MDSARFPSTPARKPRNIARGHWPHSAKLTRSKRKARAERRESADMDILRTPEALAGEDTAIVRKAIAAQKKPGFFSRLATSVGRMIRRFTFAGAM